MGPPWRIDPTIHRTMSKHSYHRATSHSCLNGRQTILANNKIAWNIRNIWKTSSNIRKYILDLYWHTTVWLTDQLKHQSLQNIKGLSKISLYVHGIHSHKCRENKWTIAAVEGTIKIESINNTLHTIVISIIPIKEGCDNSLLSHPSQRKSKSQRQYNNDILYLFKIASCKCLSTVILTLKLFHEAH